MAYPIPAGITNQKIRDWNLFLHHFNQAAERELPKDDQGRVRWDVLDKNEAFGDYKGGQDFYKKKFAEWSANNNNVAIKETDFPVMQKLFTEMYSQAQNDQPYFDKYIKPNVFRYGADESTFTPTTTRGGNENTEGWVGSVSRNFFFPQDVQIGTQGQPNSTQKFMETIFPSSFNQGEGYYKPNTANNPGVRFFEEGGQLSATKAKKILHDGTIRGNAITEKQRKFFGYIAGGGKVKEHGGKLCMEDGAEIEEEDIEAVRGGELEEISEETMEVKGPSHEKGGVDLNTGDQVRGGEIITKDGKVFGSLIDDVTGNRFDHDAKVTSQEIAKLEGRKEQWAQNKLKALQKKMDEAFERQQAKNGGKTGGKAEDGAELDPPVKKRIFYVPEDETVYDVAEDKVPKYADKLKNAKEFTEDKPEGYIPETRYFEKNGVLIEVGKDKQDLLKNPELLNTPEFQGMVELYPVQNTGQKKNKDVHAIYDDIDNATKSSGIITPNKVNVAELGVPKQELEEYNKKLKNFESFINKIPRKEGQDKAYNEILETGYLDKLYSPENLEMAKDAARSLRTDDNIIIGKQFIDDLHKRRDEFLQSWNITTAGIYDLGKSQAFKDALDKKLESGTLKVGDKTFNLDTMSKGQKEEIRNYVVGNYQTTQDLKLAQSRIEVLTNPESTGDKAIDDELNKQRQAIMNKTGVDITKLHSEDWWMKTLTEFNKNADKINKDYADLASSIPIKIQAEVKPIQDEYVKLDTELTNNGVAELQKIQQELQTQLQNGQIDEEGANKAYSQAFSTLEAQRTELFNKYNRQINKVAQQKIDAATETLKLKYEAEMSDAMKKAGIEGDPVKNAQLYNELVMWEYGNINKDATLALQKEAQWVKEHTGDWERIKTNLNRGTLQMFESLGGGLKWIGAYEAGNILTDQMDQFNAENPQYQVQWNGLESVMNKDWWIEKGVTTIPFIATMTVPGIGISGAAGATAARLGLSGIGQSLFQGFAGALATRPLESFLEAGSQFNQDLENGIDIQQASDRASSVFTDNMKLIFTDGLQLGLAFTKFGKLSGWKAGLIKMPAEMIMEGGEEVYQELAVEKLDNPYATFFNYLASPVGQETFTLGAVMGVPFAAPDLISKSSGKENHQQLGLLMDMMGDPNNLDVRYKQILDQANVLVARGMMTPAEFQQLQGKAEFVLTKGRDIPVDLAPDVRKAVLYKLADIQDANNVIATSQDPTVQAAYQDKVKEYEKQVKELISGKEPTYFINNALYTKEELTAVLGDDTLVENIVDQGVPVQIFNDPKMEKQVAERLSEFKANPEAINMAVEMNKTAEEAAMITEDQTKLTSPENQVVEKTEISEPPVNTEVIKEEPLAEEVSRETQLEDLDLIEQYDRITEEYTGMRRDSNMEALKEKNPEKFAKLEFINDNFDLIVEKLNIKKDCR